MREPMRATRTLPENYVLSGRISASGNRRLMIAMNVVGLPLIVLFGFLFVRLAESLRPEFDFGAAISGFLGTIDFDSPDALFVVVPGLVILLVLTLVVLVLHEAAHGIFFWLYTGERPRFGLTIWYAFAGAPDWYLPRDRYLVVGLAPLVLITLGGVALLPIVPPDVVLPVLFVTVFNAAGAIGDLLVTVWVLRRSPRALVNDTGDTFTIYEPGDELGRTDDAD